MSKFKLFVLGVILASCSSSNNGSRNVANKKPVVSKSKYYSHRGQKEPAKFNYDGYHAQIKLFGKAIIKPDNIKFLGTAGKLRQHLFENNLHDTGTDKVNNVDCNKVMYIKRRTPEGRCYFHGLLKKLSKRDKKLAYDVMMGSKGQRFGRNTSTTDANEASATDITTPNPFEISQRLLTRKDGKTQEAAVINVLAAAWLQAMNHDWFTHGKNSKSKHHSVRGYSKHPEFNGEEVKIPMTRPETDVEDDLDSRGYKYTSRNQVTHWWDASQIYGSDPETIKKVRTKYNSDGTSTGKLMPNGKIAVDEKNKRLYYDPKTQLPITGFNDNWWVGLEIIHSLFHLEHNKIIDKVLMPQVGKTICKAGKGIACDNELFEKARLINSALIAKIHTVEWTPALLDHPMLHIGMRGNWYGLREVFGGDSAFLRSIITPDIKHIISGLVGPKTLDLYSAPFTLTEEFVAVYRMHPLIPENINYRSVKSPNAVSKSIPVKDVIFRNANGLIKSKGASEGSSLDWMYSFGTSHPGGLMLHNYPTFMQNFVAERNTGDAHEDSTRMDMGAIDIFRDRERGVPRYNNFRRSLNLPPIEKFEDLFVDMKTGKVREDDQAKKDIQTLKEVYNGDVEQLDLLIGSLAENDRYAGYAFGNTPFWIFAIMASRRLMADPFFSDYYIPEVYTAKGIEYVQKRTMSDVIVSHFPELTDKFYDYKSYKGQGNKKRVKKVLRVKNAFRPWKPVYGKVYNLINK